MSKKFKMLFLCLIIAVTAVIGTGCGAKSNESSGLSIKSSSEKKFNKMVVQIDDNEEIVEGFDGKDISNNLLSAFNFPQKDSVKVKVILKQKGKTIATSQELELNLKKQKAYMLEFVDVSDKEVELKVKKN